MKFTIGIQKKLMLLLISTLFSCGPSLCDCVELDNGTYDPDDLPGFGGIVERTNQLFDDCRDKFDGFNNIRSRQNECK